MRENGIKTRCLLSSNMSSHYYYPLQGSIAKHPSYVPTAAEEWKFDSRIMSVTRIKESAPRSPANVTNTICPSLSSVPERDAGICVVDFARVFGQGMYLQIPVLKSSLLTSAKVPEQGIQEANAEESEQNHENKYDNGASIHPAWADDVLARPDCEQESTRCMRLYHANGGRT